MRFTEIGQQLRAYRLESGLRAEEIAARLGVSRAALYRYEKGEVIKLDTIKRLAELLKISPLSLLGIGVEYYNRPIGYFERLRQIEETADQILQLFGPVCYLTTSDSYDAALAEAFDEAADQAGSDRVAMRGMAEQVMGILTSRKRMYAMRRPTIIAMISVGSVQRLLEVGVAGNVAVSERVRRVCRQVAVTEVENMAAMMETEPMGLQFGLLGGPHPTSAFKILRARDRASLGINPFRTDTHPSAHTGVAMVTASDEAIAAHQRVAETSWREAIKGPTGAARLRQLLAAVHA
jgi:transcriptional regulator with XRE-family HTH domain